jgi:hypothetical protein
MEEATRYNDSNKGPGKKQRKMSKPTRFLSSSWTSFLFRVRSSNASLVTKAEGPKWHLKSHSRMKTKLQPTMDSGRI